MSSEDYLKPEVVRQVARLDLKARFIIEGFLQGLHASPFHGFSVEFSEHRRYSQGDDPKDIDWLVYAKTDRYYIKKYEAETNITGYLVMDLSESMAYTYRQEMTKFDYSICLAAALAYLMIKQQDPVGLVTFDQKIRQSVPARSRRTQLGLLLALLSKLKPSGETDISGSLFQLASFLKSKSLVMIFSDLLTDPEGTIESLRLLAAGGHDIILFHVLDEAEVTFPFDGAVDLEDPETGDRMQVDGRGARQDYVDAMTEFRENYRHQAMMIGADYVPLDTSMRFDRALLEYLSQRQARF